MTHYSEGWNVKLKGPPDSVFNKGPFCASLMVLSGWVCNCRQGTHSPFDLFYKDVNPIHKEHSWPNNPQTTPPLQAVTLKVRFQHINFRGRANHSNRIMWHEGQVKGVLSQGNCSAPSSVKSIRIPSDHFSFNFEAIVSVNSAVKFIAEIFKKFWQILYFSAD